MFILNLEYKKSLKEVEKHLREHIEYLDKYYEKEVFIVSGRKNPRTGGVILAKNVSIEEIREIIKEDPFYREDIARIEITEFEGSKIGKNIRL